MKHPRLLTMSSVFALAAGPVLADVTAEDLWADWKSLVESYGLTVAIAGESKSGDTLTISGLTLSSEVAQEGDFSMNLGVIEFRELGDGTVSISMSEEMPVAIDVTNPDGETAQVGFTLRQPDMSILASGDADLIRYEFEGPEISMGQMTITGTEELEDFEMDMDFTATGLSGYAEVGSGEPRVFDSVTRVDAMAMLLDFADPQGDEGRMEVRFEMQDMVQQTKGQIGEVSMDMSAAEMIGSGLRQTGTASYGPVRYTVAAETPDGPFEMAASAASGTLDMSFDENGISYGGTNNDATMTISGDMIPFPPLTFTMAESGGRFTIPLVPSEEEQEIELVMRLVDLKVDDLIWSMFDPNGILPRDPATVVLDLTGLVTLTEDFSDPDYVENAETPPGQIDALNVNELRLSFAGAELSGEGDFEFDNTAGVPTPTGTASLALTGANALMDNLVSMGLLPEDQAMGARMMLGLFARPGEGEDRLISTIEVKEDGSVLANGQRIK